MMTHSFNHLDNFLIYYLLSLIEEIIIGSTPQIWIKNNTFECFGNLLMSFHAFLRAFLKVYMTFQKLFEHI